jgi:hypothetical protein
LVYAAANLGVTDVEKALGRYPSNLAGRVVQCAIVAADAARASGRWANVAYLADFIDDALKHQHDKSDPRSSATETIGGSGGVNYSGCSDGCTDGASAGIDDVTTADGAVSADSAADADACVVVAVPANFYRQCFTDCVVSVTGKPPGAIAPEKAKPGTLDNISDCLTSKLLAYDKQASHL